MGEDGADPSEGPCHRVALDRFWVARFPVTVAQFAHYVGDGGTKPHNWESQLRFRTRPVVSVSWYEAGGYCGWLTHKLRSAPWAADWLRAALQGGAAFDLPSEAQWERAARGSQDQRRFPWGDAWDPDRANSHEAGVGRPAAVECFPRGAAMEGGQDFSGNVWEWTRSLWGEDWETPEFGYPYDERRGARERVDAPNSVLRVLRGGSFLGLPVDLRCAARLWDHPHLADDDMGFRVVLSSFPLSSGPSAL